MAVARRAARRRPGHPGRGLPGPGAPPGGAARPGAEPAIVVLRGMVVLLATGVVPPAVAGLLAAGAMILLRVVVTVEQAYRGSPGRR